MAGQRRLFSPPQIFNRGELCTNEKAETLKHSTSTKHMKKALTLITLLAGVVSGHSQGAMNLYTHGTGLTQSIWNVQPLANDNTTITYGGYGASNNFPTIAEEQGSTSASTETPQGTTVYAASTYLGGSVSAGTGFDAQLLAVAGVNQPLNSLVPVGGILNFNTAAAAPGVLFSSVTDLIPGTTEASPVATIAIAVWNNGGGQYSTLASAVGAGEYWGVSSLANITTTFAPNIPALMDTASDLNFSFSLGTEVPEPGMIALGLLGASTFLLQRRKYSGI
jgi:hypothetical protein